MSPRVWVAGVPAAQGSKRHVGGGKIVESSKAVGPWRERVAAELATVLGEEHEPTRFGVVVNARFLFLRPGGHFGSRPCLACLEPTRADLLERARTAEIAGRSKMTTAELAGALGTPLDPERPCAVCEGSRRERYVLASAPRTPAARPDLDKLLRAVLDAMTAVAFVDDGQVVALNAGKEYGNTAGLELRWDVIA